MPDLRPYRVGTPDPEDGCDLVWALDAAAAIAAVRSSSWHFTDIADLDLEVDLQDFTSGTEPEASASHVESRTWVLRQYGFGFVGDARCFCCALPTMGSEFPLCDDCEQCDECGHDEGCSSTEDDDDGLYFYAEGAESGAESGAELGGDDDLPPEAR